MKSRGFGLVEVLIASGLMAVVSLGILALMRYQDHSNREMMAKSSTTELSASLNMLLGSPGCGSSAVFLSGGAPSVVSVGAGTYSVAVDTIRFSSGGTVITSLPSTAIASMMRGNWISSITMTALGGEAPSGTGFVYPFHLVVSFQTQKGFTPRPVHKFLFLYTNGANQVTGGCFAGNKPDIVVTTGVVGHGTNLSPPTGYDRSSCALLVQGEDHHIDADYSSNFGDTVNWHDNHYGGAQSFADTNWTVTCRHGLHSSNSFGQPVWFGSWCRYTIACTKI